MTKSYKAELRVLKRASKEDLRDMNQGRKALLREITKLSRQCDRIAAGYAKRADQRARRISILEGRIHS